MSSIVAVPELSPAGIRRVRLTLTWTAPIPEQARVWRIGPTGERHAVRQADPVAMATSGSTVVYDYEADADVASTWELTAVDGSTVAATTTATVPSLDLAWLVHPGAPEWSIPVAPLVGAQVILEQWPTWNRAITRGVLTSPSRRSPIVSSGLRQAETGELRLLALDIASADKLERILSDGSALLLLPPATLDHTSRWVSVGDVTEEPLDRRGTTRDLTRWTLPLTVVDAPAGQALAARTYAASSAESATYGESLLRWPTYQARSGAAASTGGGGSTPPGADANGVTLVAPTATVSGSGVTLQAPVEWADAITFTYLQISVRPPSGSAGTAFSTGFAPGTTAAAAGSTTLLGSGTCDVAGVWTARVAYALAAAGPWVEGPATEFTVTTAGTGGGGGTTPPTTGTVIGQTDFTGTTGAALPSPWATGEMTAGATAALDAGEAKLATGTATAYAGRSTMRWTSTVPNDVEVRAKVRFTAAEAFLAITVRGDSAGAGQSGYQFLVSPVQSSGLFAISAWNASPLATDTTRPVAGTAKWFALRVQGTQVQAKQWAVGDPEPTAWAMTATNSSSASGSVYLQAKGGDAAGGSVWIDDVTITDLTGVSTVGSGGGSTGGGGGGGGSSAGVLLGASGPQAANGTLAAQLASRTVGVGGTWCDASAAVQLELWSISPGGEWSGWQGALDIAIGAIFKTAGETWSAAAGGAYDARWTTVLTRMASYWAPRANSLLKIRFGHECNGSFIPDWNVQPSEVSNYITAYRRFANLARTHVPGAVLVWPLNDGSSTGFDFRTAYPGDAYVDMIGVDTYNQWPWVNNLAAWNTKINSVDGYGCPVGVEAWRQYALSKGKPLCIPEWSNNGDVTHAGGGGESPFYVQQMASWARANAGTGPGQVAYMVLFNQWTQYQMWPTTIQPQTWAAYKAVF